MLHCAPKLKVSLNPRAFIPMKDEAGTAVPSKRKTKRAATVEATNAMMEILIDFPLEREMESVSERRQRRGDGKERRKTNTTTHRREPQMAATRRDRNKGRRTEEGWKSER